MIPNKRATRITAYLILAIGSSCPSRAETKLSSFSEEILRDVATLSSQPTVRAWQRSHHDLLQPAHYQTAEDPYEVDYQQLGHWCAAAVDHSSAGVTRGALFFVPASGEGQAAIENCELKAVWFQTPTAMSLEILARELSAKWGAAETVHKRPFIDGAARWTDVSVWHRGGVTIWAGVDPFGKGITPHPRFVVYATTGMVQESYRLDDPPEAKRLVKTAVKTAATNAKQSARLTEAMGAGSFCFVPNSALKKASVLLTVTAWLQTARSQPPAQKAASFLLADFYLACQQLPPSSNAALQKLGIHFESDCPIDGPGYSHNLLAEAEQLDTNSPTGRLAAVLRLSRPCLLKGSTFWPDLVIQKGEDIVRKPADEWTPYVHVMLARAHEAKLAFASPGGDPEGVVLTPSTPAAMQQERTAALSNFEQVLAKAADIAEIEGIKQESWRLRANLPPSPFHFGCGCD